MSYSSLVQATSPSEGVRLITLNRPEKRNAMSQVLLGQLLAELKTASDDPTVKAIVITGSGKFFSAGADLKDIAGLDAAGARACRYLEDLCDGMGAVRKPLLAAVNGPALGGGFEVALMCDLIFASKSAYFSLPETQKGLIPGAGGTQRLTAAVGKFRAMRTIVMGRPITAEEALSWGLVCDLAEDGDMLWRTIAAAKALAEEHGPEALLAAKEAVCRADGLCRDELFERNLYYTSFGTEEKRKGVDEFLAKRGR
ncbi:Crotonase, core [Moelleriella libera RCEF 2490]|uniref:Crotonase, core n=1 Tax=Moelleriella libera RCEF 2490 TaxID=1081109 RepID=A0A166PAP4_9HYPO|nr:Crotonase, core [Moelleriella libera RCEF 2490]